MEWLSTLRSATLGLGALLLFSLSSLIPAPALAQSSALDRVEEFTRLGRAEEARAVLAEWWGGDRDDASQRDLQRGLWLRGRLTVDPAQAELDFQRLAVLYPSGPYTPQALFRLAQAAHARGDEAGAQRHVDALARDYPNATSRTQAEAWLRAAGRAPAVGAAATTVMPADTSVSGIRSSGGRAPAPADVELDWSVQFGAFSDEDRAFALQTDLVAAGLAARLVHVVGSGFVHVRIGRFATRDEASRQLEEVARRGFTAAIVRDDRAEEVVRR
jgi:hypothetical protein